MPKCSCANPKCEGEIHIEATMARDTVLVTIEMSSGRYGTLYLDANGIIALIKELREGLNMLAGFREELICQ